MHQSIFMLILVYLALRLKLYCLGIGNVLIYIWHFERWPLLSMKHDSYYVIGHQGNAVKFFSGLNLLSGSYRVLVTKNSTLLCDECSMSARQVPTFEPSLSKDSFC